MREAKTMKILMIETGGWGGICHYTYNLSQALAKFTPKEGARSEGQGLPAGFTKVTVVTDTEYELDNYDRDFCLKKVLSHNQPYVRRVYVLFRTIFRENPDIVHIQTLFTARKDWFVYLILRLLGVKVVLTVHNVLPHEEYERMAKGVRFALKNIYTSCRALITHSEYNKKELIEGFDTNDYKISVIPHGHYIFHSRHRPELTKDLARKRLGLSPKDKVVLCFGAIREYKGIQYLILAFQKVIKEVKDARLIIVGPAEKGLAARYNELIKKYNLQEVVKFHPRYIPMDEIGLYFKASDIAVFPYLHTYGSGALQSAFAFSKPVIVTDVGVFREMVKDGQNGFITPPKDIDALAKAIIKCLLMDGSKLQKMGKDLFHLAKTKYNWEDIAESTTAVYKEIAGYDKVKILIVAPDFGPPYNERWKNKVKAHSQILNASVLGTSTINRLMIKDANFLIFNNFIIVRYAIFLLYLLFIQRRYDYVIFEGNIDSRFNQVIYKLVRKGLLDAKRCIGTSYVTQKWINPGDKQAVFFIKNILPRLKYFLANDEKEKQALVELTYASDNLLAIRPGVVLENYGYTDDWRPGDREFSFLFASAPQGRWGYKAEFYNKGLYILLSAFKRFIKEHPGRLYLIWRGVFSEEIRSLIYKLNLEDNAEVVDGLVDTIRYYRSCSVAVFPVRNLTGSPHYPMSVMESLACGHPVIVSNKIRISTIINGANCGLVIEPEEESLYKAMCYCFDNYEGLRVNCRKAAEKYFDYRKNLDVLIRRLKGNR